MHDSNGRKKSYLIADNRRKISAFDIYRIHILYILHIGMFKYWSLRSGIDIWRIKLKSPNHFRYRLSVWLWGVEVISASKRHVWTSGAKNTTVYFKLTRSWGDYWSSCPILLLINKIKIVSDIGWSSLLWLSQRQTGRQFAARMKERQSAVRRQEENSLLAIHCPTTGHAFDWTRASPSPDEVP